MIFPTTPAVQFRLLMTSVIIASTSSVIAAEPSASAKAKGDASQVDETVGEKLDRGPIDPTTSIIGAKVVSEKGEKSGQIADLMLDLQYGHVSAAIIDLQGSDKGTMRQVAIPWGALKRTATKEFQLQSSAGQLDRATKLESKDWDSKATRRWASSVYKQFGVQERVIKEGAPKLSDDDHLFRASALNNVKVNDLSGAELGHLAGVAVASRDGLIVYAALATSDSNQKLLAIPLSAFIVKPSQKEWLLDITKDALAARPTFPSSAWPEAIDAGWSEYVHVLYGRATFEGVRSVPKSTTGNK